MDTDTAEWTQVPLRLVRLLASQRVRSIDTRVKGNPYLCPSVFICGGVKRKRRPFAEPPFPTNPNHQSNSLLDHEFQEVRHAAAIAPLVVVPAYQLEEPLVQLDAGALIVNGGGLAVDEIRADHFIFGVFENAFEVGLAGLLHRGADLSVAGLFDRPNREVHDGDGGGRDAAGHAGG